MFGQGSAARAHLHGSRCPERPAQLAALPAGRLATLYQLAAGLAAPLPAMQAPQVAPGEGTRARLGTLLNPELAQRPLSSSFPLPIPERPLHALQRARKNVLT